MQAEAADTRLRTATESGDLTLLREAIEEYIVFLESSSLAPPILIRRRSCTAGATMAHS